MNELEKPSLRHEAGIFSEQSERASRLTAKGKAERLLGGLLGGFWDGYWVVSGRVIGLI